MDVNICLTQRDLKGCEGLSIIKLPLNQRPLRTHSLYVMKHEEETFKQDPDWCTVQSAMPYISISNSGLPQQQSCAAQGWPQTEKPFLRRSN